MKTAMTKAADFPLDDLDAGRMALVLKKELAKIHRVMKYFAWGNHDDRGYLYERGVWSVRIYWPGGANWRRYQLPRWFNVMQGSLFE